jgi:hypothetical protein
MEPSRHTPLTAVTATFAAGLAGCRLAGGRDDRRDAARARSGHGPELHRDRYPSGLASIPFRQEV